MKRNALIAPLCCLALCSAPKIAKADVAPEVGQETSTQYAAGSVLVSGFNVLSIVNNAGGQAPSSPAWGYLGLVGGVVGMGLGGASLVESNEANPAAIGNLALGAMTTVFALSAIKHAKSQQTRDQDQAVTGHMPMHFAYGVVGARGHQHGLGVQLTF